MKTEEVKRIYNDVMPEKFGKDYEYNRWFKTPALKAAYDMTRASIERHVLHGNQPCKYVFELGPGAGTWSKLLLEKKFAGHLDMLDISSQMLFMAKSALLPYPNTGFMEKDFLAFRPDRAYDFFFSSRVFEYLPDKEKAVAKISRILPPGGRGFIITKTPKYPINKLLGRKVSEFHRGQISPRELKRIFQRGGFSEIKIYPVTLSFPIFKSAGLNMALHKIFGSLPLNPVSAFFSESYSIQFVKK
jgi:ubiquinone/menaquinone biosynthesis C-methylase UbiE